MLESSKKNHKIKYFYWTLLSIIFCNLSACYEDTEGCLDLYAANYNVSADLDCDDCCKYPTLNANFSYKIDTTWPTVDTILPITLKKDSLYTNNLQQSYSVKAFYFLVKDMSWITISDQLVNTTKTINLPVLNNKSLTISDNINYYSIKKSSFIIPDVVTTEELKGVSFQIGLSDLTNQIDTSRLKENETLAIVKKHLYNNDHYLSGRLTYTKSLDISSEVFFLDLKNSVNIKLYLDETRSFSLGSNNNIALNINFDKLFLDLDLNNSTSDQLNMQFAKNIGTAYSIK